MRLYIEQDLTRVKDFTIVKVIRDGGHDMLIFIWLNHVKQPGLLFKMNPCYQIKFSYISVIQMCNLQITA